MKKSIRVVLFILLCLVILALIWVVLFAYTKKPVYEHNYQGRLVNPEYYTVIKASQAVEDIEQYIYDIKHNHPKPFAFISETELDQHAAALKAEFSKKDDITVGELYLALMEIVGMIDDSHTTIHWPSFDNLFEIPLDIRYVNGKFYNVKRDAVIPYKSEILAINSIKSDELYDMLAKFSYTPLESGTEKYVQGIFKIMLPLLMGTDVDYVVEYKHDDEIKTETIQLIEWTNTRKNPETVRTYIFEHNDKSIPVLECNSFSGDFNAFKRVVNDFFKKYADSEYIVIDIRNNGGGSDSWGNYVFNHIAGDTYRTFGDFQIPVNDYSKAFYTYRYQKELYDYKIPSIFWNIALDIVPDFATYRKLLNTDNGAVLKQGPSSKTNPVKAADRYEGKVFLLIGGKTGSAAIDLATAFEYNQKDGIILGQETNHPASYSGNATVYSLPNSKLNYRLPISWCISADGLDDKRGVIPDYILNFGIDEYEDERDPELEFLLEEIENL